MKTTLFLLLACLYLIFAIEDVQEAEFNAWMRLHNKNYETETERQYRFNVWKANSEIITELRAKNSNARYGHNKFGDLSPVEFASKYLGKISSSAPIDKPTVAISSDIKALPKAYDWRDKNAVTAVKDQGQCGSCWAFSAVETIESQWFLAGHPLTVLSEQQVVDCDLSNGDEGCNGGDTVTAYQYVIKAGGLETEKDYPYTAEDDTCAFKASDVAAKISDWKYVTKNKNETAMQIALMQYGPLSICVDAESWQFYLGGVITDFCGDSLDHCVQITGFSVQNGELYGTYDVWNIRNSWGADWGENGYIWVERDYDLCGLADEVTLPVV
eukprot:TRINITY_DN16_c0_g1_i1.p1 TRINITY_DN16_c0_g1~~TRINITY_DN16_c0_g1_i1.p1  ORF type:complete len:328 (+),score=64.47 TRINITY_DN16_c0_g1_i1:64-1047(+)